MRALSRGSPVILFFINPSGTPRPYGRCRQACHVFRGEFPHPAMAVQPPVVACEKPVVVGSDARIGVPVAMPIQPLTPDTTMP